jgi:hypothetical protein
VTAGPLAAEVVLAQRHAETAASERPAQLVHEDALTGAGCAGNGIVDDLSIEASERASGDRFESGSDVHSGGHPATG